MRGMFLCFVGNKVLFCFRGVTGTGYQSGLCCVLSINYFMFCFKYRLILDLFYVLF